MQVSQDQTPNAVSLSLIYPGLGQALQGRTLSASWHALEFTGFFVAGLVRPEHQWLWWGAAALTGLYSIVDAYRGGRRPELL